MDLLVIQCIPLKQKQKYHKVGWDQLHAMEHRVSEAIATRILRRSKYLRTVLIVTMVIWTTAKRIAHRVGRVGRAVMVRVVVR